MPRRRHSRDSGGLGLPGRCGGLTADLQSFDAAASRSQTVEDPEDIPAAAPDFEDPKSVPKTLDRAFGHGRDGLIAGAEPEMRVLRS
jgi:hypothetical protein